ncbi:LysM peptidoglycan-binding domain-containing protein [Mycolicibacterium sp.]|uniref:LysM peptidoglycan-binding domain-containing protein n=1 Tax=Mycolicibacterium sp. TaxID=2320850 RepID=UPI001A17FE15|nr:LysM peptidoglycan-binding domain-containing protein [Mycolicibacterium sp.]MBJ7338224.1 LysM peptidoglycan-binding domain-containing protein [Mycolicibacterium sp.]
MKTYHVRPGDTLSEIALHEYGDATLYPVISRQNHLLDPDVITAGQDLLIPYVTVRHHVTTADSTEARTKLTLHYYGTDDPRIQLIWEIANGVAQREIQPGAWLLMPDLASVGHHTVTMPESLDTLADRWYGEMHLAELIRLANDIPSRDDVAEGQTLIVPGLNRRVQVAGDTLESLCRDQYGDADLATRVAVVAAANRIDDPNSVVSSQVIQIPS